MKRFLAIILIATVSLTGFAQADSIAERPTSSRPTPLPLPVREGSGMFSNREVTTPLPHREGQGEGLPEEGLPKEGLSGESLPEESLSREASDGLWACRGWAETPWLHQGLNVDLSLSAFATFGKHARHGGGFGQSLSATWLQPVGDKLWVAAGGRISNINYGGDSYRDGSLYLMAGYRFNERWEAYVYAEKNIGLGNHAPHSLSHPLQREGRSAVGRRFCDSLPFGGVGGGYPFGGVGGDFYGTMPVDRIGAAVRYNFSPTCSMQISVEGIRPATNHTFQPTHQYNYPIGENY